MIFGDEHTFAAKGPKMSKKKSDLVDFIPTRIFDRVTNKQFKFVKILGQVSKSKAVERRPRFIPFIYFSFIFGNANVLACRDRMQNVFK